MKPEIVRRPTPPQAEFVTLSQVEQLIDRKLERLLKISEERTHRTLSGFSARLFYQLPRKITAAISENTSVTLDSDALTKSLMKTFQGDFEGTCAVWNQPY